MHILPLGVSYNLCFKMVLITDGHSVATGKTVAITLSKNTGTFNNPSVGALNATEMANGMYFVTLSAADLDTAGDLIVRGTAAACDDLLEVCQVSTGVRLLDGVAHGGTLGSSTATLALRAADVTSVSEHAINIVANGTSKHGILVTGGTGGTSDGIKVVAGTGGVGFRSDILSQALTESYADDGAAFTAAQALYEICQLLEERNLSGTTLIVKKRDGSTTALTLTIDSATTPTMQTRAT